MYGLATDSKTIWLVWKTRLLDYVEIVKIVKI